MRDGMMDDATTGIQVDQRAAMARGLFAVTRSMGVSEETARRGADHTDDYGSRMLQHEDLLTSSHIRHQQAIGTVAVSGTRSCPKSSFVRKPSRWHGCLMQSVVVGQNCWATGRWSGAFQGNQDTGNTQGIATFEKPQNGGYTDCLCTDFAGVLRGS